MTRLLTRFFSQCMFINQLSCGWSGYCLCTIEQLYKNNLHRTTYNGYFYVFKPALVWLVSMHHRTTLQGEDHL